MIPQNTIQQIHNHIDIVDIVGAFVKLKKRGASYLGLCPFHNEKSPSFTVSASKEIYKCFGCGKSGSAINFLMEHEKYSYVEAIRWLARKYGVEIEEKEASPEVKLQQQLADSLFIINNFARDYFVQTLFETEEGQSVGLSYFRERGFSEETVRKFQLGYSLNERDAFVKAALAKGYNQEYLLKTGLIAIRNEQPMDNYRGRVIFPIHNQSGKVLGFGARILVKSDRAPKYINSPENDIYVKSKVLYGTYFARHSIDRLNECLLVEGYTDVVSLHQAGVENVVASSGTSLTTDQLRLIKKYTNNLTILYDGDNAGVKAALRGLDMAIEEGLNVKLALIPDGGDPDSYVRKIGAEAFRNFIAENKQDFILFKIQVSLGEAGTDPTKKSQLVNEIAATIGRIDKIEDFSKQQEYIRQSSQLLKIDEHGMITLVNKYIRDRLHHQQPPAAHAVAEIPGIDASFLNKDDKQERELVKVLLRFGHKPFGDGKDKTVADYIFHLPYDFESLAESAVVKKILREYQKGYDAGQLLDRKWFLYHPDEEIARNVAEILKDNEADLSSNWKEKYEIETICGDNAYLQDTISVTHYLMLCKIKKMIMENQQEMEQAPDMDHQVRCMEMHQHLKQMEVTLTQELGTVIFK